MTSAPPKHPPPGAPPLAINHDAKEELIKQELKRSASRRNWVENLLWRIELRHMVTCRAKNK